MRGDGHAPLSTPYLARWLSQWPLPICRLLSTYPLDFLHMHCDCIRRGICTPLAAVIHLLCTDMHRFSRTHPRGIPIADFCNPGCLLPTFGIVSNHINRALVSLAFSKSPCNGLERSELSHRSKIEASRPREVGVVSGLSARVRPKRTRDFRTGSRGI